MIKLIVVKSGKYLKGWNYGPFGRKFNWTKNKDEAIVFDARYSDADNFANITKGHIEEKK